MIRLYISASCSQDGGEESETVGLVPKMKWRRNGPRRPKRSIAKGMSVMLLCKMLPMIASPRMLVPVVGSFLFATVELLFFVDLEMRVGIG